VHHLSGYQRALGPVECRSVPVTDQIAREVLSLPMYPALADSDVAHITDALLALGGRTSPAGEAAVTRGGTKGAELAGQPA
jgi:perosamine synthetase